MASYQRVALFIFFDALERDLVEHIRRQGQFAESILTEEERSKALERRRSKLDSDSDGSDLEILQYLDFGDKLSILQRIKANIESGFRSHFDKKYQMLVRSISVRNSTMHGRPLTTEEYAIGFSLAQDLIQTPGYWPTLHSIYNAFAQNPDRFIGSSITFLDDAAPQEALNNLPIPDYDDTGFLPRNALQDEITKKIRSRHPAVCVLGDGGNGKTALTLQTLYSLLSSNEHEFDAIVWVSAKTNKLTTKEVVRIEGAITTSIGVFSEAADLLEPGEDDPIERVRRLLEENAVLLVIDNLETVLDESLVKFVEEIPDKSKILVTSRVPLDGALSIQIPEFTSDEAIRYLRQLINSYDVSQLRSLNQKKLGVFASRLGNKPLLLKWFAIGVSQGIDPNRIVANPEMALRFCLENVIDRLDETSLLVLSTMSAIPNALSGPIIEHCGLLTSAEVEAGLATLLRFGLVERVLTANEERNFRIKPFVRAYVLRAAKISASDPSAIVTRYRAIDATFQTERGVQKSSKYDRRFLLVRTKSEAVVAMRIKHAINLAFRGRHDQAEQIFEDLLISSPDYFEVHRAMAFVAARHGDSAAADSRYEAAIELEPDLPQLRYFYGRFLMIALANYEGAAAEFAKALELDPNEIRVLQEAIRVQQFVANFPEASRLLERAKMSDDLSEMDLVIITDLEGQLYTRHLEYLFTVSDAKSAMELAKEFHGFLSKLSPLMVDQKMSTHLLKAVPYLEALLESQHCTDDAVVESSIKTIHEMAANATSKNLSETMLSGGNHERFGFLKKEGRTDRFGFIKDTIGTDTYVSRSSVNSVLWTDMCEGHPVRFDLIRDADGKTRAENVVLVG